MNKSASTITRLIALLLLTVMTLSMVSCDMLPIDFDSIFNGGEEPPENPEAPEKPETPDEPETPVEPEKPACNHDLVYDGKCFVCGEIIVITIAEALELCGEDGNVTKERYYIRATVKTVLNPQYGQMILQDETGEIEVYGTYSHDGELPFNQIEETPVKGDEVLLHCILQNYGGTKEVKNARLIEFTHNDIPFDESNYTEMTVAEARDADEDSLVIVNGVVARITYANGRIPNGVILVDGTSSIYIFNGDVAAQVEIGNTVRVAGRKTYWVLGSELDSAEKFGYKGANQIDEATLISNDKKTSDFDKSWIEESSVKEMLDTPFSEDITSKIFKVNALVSKVDGSGFVNYYFNDIDGVTGSYTYTQCSGGDFDWLDEFDGKICTVYLTVLNAKSTSAGCVWRFLPVAVIDEGYSFDLNDSAEYAVKYHGVVQFLNNYTGDPAKALTTTVSSELLGIEGATLSYASSDESVIYFTNQDGAVTFHCGEAGTATVTVTGKYGEITYSETVEITVEANADYDTVSIEEAIGKNIGDEVIIRGIIGPSLVNQPGFYLFDESGMVAVRVYDDAVFDTIEIGQEVVIKGKRDLWHKEGYSYGQICISNATVEANYYGEHTYSTDDFITDKDLEYFYNLDENDMTQTHTVYTLTATIVLEDTQYSKNIYLVDGDTKVRLYCSGYSQYGWLKPYNGQTVTVEVAPCNWNSKNYYTGCVLAIILEDGTKIYNDYNFQ